MKTLPSTIKSALASRFGAAPGSLKFLGGGQDWSDGTLFSFPRGEGRRVIKFLDFDGADKGARARAEERLGYIRFFGDSGCRIVSPVESARGILFETEEEGGRLYLAYAYEMAEGRIMGSREIDQGGGAWVAAMGRELAALHAAWESRPGEGPGDGSGGIALGGWREEMGFFRAWCADPAVSALFARLEERFASLPVGKGEYGFVHNDFHPGNLVVAHDNLSGPGARFTLLDFDVANFHWFSCDASIALYSFEVMARGGPETGKPLPPGYRERMAEAFWRGYSGKRAPSPWMLAQIDLFRLYRSCLMFTVFQDMTKEKPEWRNHWRGVLEIEGRRLL